MDEETNSGWEYKPSGAIDSDSPSDDEGKHSGSNTRHSNHPKAVSWEAPEYIEHHHGPLWYLSLILATAALATVIYLVSTHDIIATIIVATLGVIVGVFASNKPSVAKYEVNGAGLNINGKTYKYGDYKSFSIIREGSLSSVNLLPLKRFMPPVAAYFEPGTEKKIVGVIGNYLPYEDRKLDGIERLSRRLRL